jgi:hypothetical protein
MLDRKGLDELRKYYGVEEVDGNGCALLKKAGEYCEITSEVLKDAFPYQTKTFSYSVDTLTIAVEGKFNQIQPNVLFAA